MSSRRHLGTERSLGGPLQSFDLGVEAFRLREEEAFVEGGRNSVEPTPIPFSASQPPTVDLGALVG